MGAAFGTTAVDCLEVLARIVESPSFSNDPFERADFLETCGVQVAQVLELATRVAQAAGIDIEGANNDGGLYLEDDPREETRQARFMWAISTWGFRDGKQVSDEEIASEFRTDVTTARQLIDLVNSLPEHRQMPKIGAIPDPKLLEHLNRPASRREVH